MFLKFHVLRTETANFRADFKGTKMEAMKLVKWCNSNSPLK